MSSTAENLIFSLQRRHGFGVRPAAYSATKSSTTSWPEPLGQVPDVERDADHVGRAPGVPGVLEGAAAAGAGAERLRVAGQREVHAGDVVAGLGGPGGRDGGVDAAGHRGEHPHRDRARAISWCHRRRRSGRPGGPARRPGRSPRRRRRRRPAVEVCPKENRSEPRASASGTPIASSTWLGCGTPAEQAEPVEHSMPRASSSSSSASPSQPGNEKCALPGSRCSGDRSRVAAEDGVRHDLAHPAYQVVTQPGHAARPAPPGA